jgi:hypothetical protein
MPIPDQLLSRGARRLLAPDYEALDLIGLGRLLPELLRELLITQVAEALPPAIQIVHVHVTTPSRPLTARRSPA